MIRRMVVLDLLLASESSCVIGVDPVAASNFDHASEKPFIVLTLSR